MKKWLVVVILALVLALAFSGTAMAGSRYKGRKPIKTLPPQSPIGDIYHPPDIRWEVGDGLWVALFW
jgi:hypothetical protein